MADFFKKSDIHYKALIDMAADAIISLDRTGKILLMNPAAENICGYGRDEVVGENLMDLLVPERSRDLFYECLSRESCRDMEMLLARKDGSLFPAELSFSAEMKSDGNSERTIIIRDVTDRRQAAEALRKSEERLRFAQDAAKAGTWEWDLRTNENTWSEELWKLYGLDPHKYRPSYEAWRQAIHPDDRAAVERAVQEAASRGSELNTEWRVMDHDGSIRWLMSRGKPQRAVDGRPIRYIGIVVDITERKRAEKALQASEERYRGLFESMNEGFALHEMICDEQGNPCDYRFIDVNPAFERQTGLKREEVIGRTVRETLPGTEMFWINRYGEVVLTGKPAHFESHSSALGRDYEVFAYRAEPGQFAVIFLDITERKRTEEALRETRERAEWLARFPEDNPNPVVRVSAEGRVLYRNPGAGNHPGWEFEAGQPLPEPFLSLVVQVMAEGKELQRDVKSGERVYSVSAMPFPAERYANLYGMDITERIEAEKAMRESEARYRSYIEVTGQLGWTTNAEGEVVEELPSFQQYTGQNFDELRGWGWTRALHPDDRELTRTVWQKAVEDKQGYETEYRLRRYDGVYRYFLARGVPILDEDGSVREWVGTCVDITERNQAEDALRRAKDELEDRVRERTAELTRLLEDLRKSRNDLRLLASELVLAEERERQKISVTLHDEVAQTLAATRMRIDLLRSGVDDTALRHTLDEAQQLLVRAIRETRSLMTDISSPVLYDMGLQVAVQSLAEDVGARQGIPVTCSFSGSFNNLSQDVQVMIFQLVKEFVQNIAKHSQARKASLHLTEQKDTIRVVVADDGQGFDAGNVIRVGSDSGFGLFSIRERVRSFDGKIAIESEPGKGCTVTVVLPKTARSVKARGKGSSKTKK